MTLPAESRYVPTFKEEKEKQKKRIFFAIKKIAEYVNLVFIDKPTPEFAHH